MAYLEIPKVCCTTLKAMLQGEELGISPDELTLPQIHDRKASPLWNFDRLSTQADSGYRTFTFVRNPYTRIYSAYREKLVNNPAEKQLRAEALGLRPDRDIRFIDFLRAIKERDPSGYDIHWLPQSLIAEGRQFDYIGRFEQFDNDYFIIASALGLPLHASARRVHSTGTGTSILGSLSTQEVGIINSVYEDDFLEFGYLMLE